MLNNLMMRCAWWKYRFLPEWRRYNCVLWLNLSLINFDFEYSLRHCYLFSRWYWSMQCPNLIFIVQETRTKIAAPWHSAAWRTPSWVVTAWSDPGAENGAEHLHSGNWKDAHRQGRISSQPAFRRYTWMSPNTVQLRPASRKSWRAAIFDSKAAAFSKVQAIREKLVQIYLWRSIHC